MKQNLQLVGTTRIFAKEIDGKTFYSTSISNRNLDGTYEKMYITVQFPKDTVIDNQTDVTILESFMSFYKNKDGIAKPKIVVMKFEQESKDEFVSNEQLPF